MQQDTAVLIENNEGEVTMRKLTVLGTNESWVPTEKQVVLMDDENLKFYFLTIMADGTCSFVEEEPYTCYEVFGNKLFVSKGIWSGASYNFDPAPIDIQGILDDLKKALNLFTSKKERRTSLFK